MNFSILKELVTAPAQCRLCGSGTREWYLDTGHSEEFYGAVVYCCNCIEHMADLCGYLTPSVRQQLENTVIDAERQVFELKIQLDGYREVASGLSKLGVTFGSDSRESVDDYPIGPSLEGRSEYDEGASETRDSMGIGEGTSVESGHVERVVDVPTKSEHDGSHDYGFNLQL